MLTELQLLFARPLNYRAIISDKNGKIIHDRRIGTFKEMENFVIRTRATLIWLSSNAEGSRGIECS